MKKPESVCIFGDSTAWGAWDFEKGGWVNRLWLDVAKRTDGECFIHNLSISGGTTQTILDRFESESKVRGADALIFQSGGNDCYLVGKNGPNKISIDQFKKNVEEIIKRAKVITNHIIFMGFKIVDETKSAPVSWEDIYYINSEIKRYDEAMHEVCLKNNVSYIDMLNVIEVTDLDDGVHPNAAGHEKIFEKVRDALISEGWI